MSLIEAKAVWKRTDCSVTFFFKQKSAYDVWLWLEFRRVLFRSMVVIIPVSLVFLVIPFGPASLSCHAPAGAGGCGFWGENFDVGVFFVLAISAISVIGMLMAGIGRASCRGRVDLGGGRII